MQYSIFSMEFTKGRKRPLRITDRRQNLKYTASLLRYAHVPFPVFAKRTTPNLYRFGLKCFVTNCEIKWKFTKLKCAKKITFLIAGHYKVFKNKRRVLLNFFVMRKLPNTLRQVSTKHEHSQRLNLDIIRVHCPLGQLSLSSKSTHV